MHTSFKYSIVLAAFNCISIQAMDTQSAKIEEGIVKKATHYRLIQGGITMVHSRTEQPVEVINKPKAFFYGYDHEKREREFLGAVEVEALNKQAIEHLDKLIDPCASLPVIKKAAIGHCLKRGRMIFFYDQQGNEVLTSYHYNGSIDLKSEEENTRLPKPHALLQQLEEVRESIPQAWYLALLGVANTENSVIYK